MQNQYVKRPKIAKYLVRIAPLLFLEALYDATYTFSSTVPQSMSLNLTIYVVWPL